MLLFLCLLLQQAPTLTPAGSLDLEDGDRRALAVSVKGKYLVLGEPDRLRILDAETLAAKKDLVLRWTAFGFDDRDERLLVVGDEAIVFRTVDWAVQTRARLPDAAFVEARVPDGLGTDIMKNRGLRPGQALVLPDLDFYYCAAAGGLTVGSFTEGKLDAKPMNLKSDFRISRVFAQLPTVLLLGIENNVKAAIALRGSVSYLVGCDTPFFAADLGSSVVCVGAEDEVLYSRSTWRVTAVRKAEGTTCAAVDGTSGWVFLGDGKGLRGWSAEKFAAPVRFDAIKERVLHLAVDAPRRTLFSLERKVLRRWKLG
ncbi:MAG TPA: hypothetical protein VNM14_06595 [Planctomycetota bacterium]|nr:hypothetical protein [Planctomycetota bacterium]